MQYLQLKTKQFTSRKTLLENILSLMLKTLFNIVGAQFKTLLNFDMSALYNNVQMDQ